MNAIDETRDMVGVGVWVDAVTEVENMPRRAPELLENLTHFGFDFLA